jgi:hypothetical protein
MSDLRDSFGKRVLECVDDLSKTLPGLVRRYDRVVVVSAMAEHVGKALRVLLRRQVCDTADARLLIGRMESAAFFKGRRGPDGPLND